MRWREIIYFIFNQDIKLLLSFPRRTQQHGAKNATLMCVRRSWLSFLPPRRRDFGARSRGSNFALMDLLFANQSGAASIAPLLRWHTAARNIVFKFTRAIWLCSQRKKHAQLSYMQRGERIFCCRRCFSNAKTQKNWHGAKSDVCTCQSSYIFMKPRDLSSSLTLFVAASYSATLWRKVRLFYWRIIPDDCTLGMRLSCELCWEVTIS